MYRDDIIRAAMGAQRLSRAKLAKKSGLNVNTVSDICRGKLDIKLPSLIKVANTLRLDLPELFEPKPSQSRTA
jgi:transcriptional regulator with XRE-family HTH domain